MKRFAAAAALLALVGVTAEAQEKLDTPKGFYAIGPKSRIYIQGRAYIDTELVWATDPNGAGAKVYPTPRVQENSSYLRFRGEYDLGDKWTSWAQIESEIVVDGSTGNGSPFSGFRNSAFGLSGPYGTLFMGYWDTPFKESTTNIDSWSATGIQSTYNVNGQMLNYTAATGALASGNRWNSRLGNSVSYMTPKYEGLYARVAAGFGEVTPATRSAKRPYAVSAGVFYDGPIYLAVAYEYRKALTLAAPVTGGGIIAADGTDQGFRAAASYKFKPTFTKVSAGFEWLQAKNDASNEDLSKWDVFVDVAQGLGSDRHQLILTGGYASDYSGNFLANKGGNADTGAIYWSAGYRFNWTKDLYLYVVATQIANSKNAIYTFGNSALSGFGAGASPTGVATGMLYLF